VVTYISNSVAETEEIGRQFSEQSERGWIVALEGALGTGKTHFTKGFVSGLGSDAIVTSPTFTIVHEYRGGRAPIYHFDFFRVDDRESLIRLDLDDYLFGDGICVIEWADRFPDLIPENAHWITLAMDSAETRTINIR